MDTGRASAFQSSNVGIGVFAPATLSPLRPGFTAMARPLVPVELDGFGRYRAPGHRSNPARFCGVPQLFGRMGAAAGVRGSTLSV